MRIGPYQLANNLILAPMAGITDRPFREILHHLEKLYSFYGNTIGVKIARKHIGWYFDSLSLIGLDTRKNINQAVVPSQQLMLVNSALNLLT